MGMKRAYYRIGFTAGQSAELWERWKKGRRPEGDWPRVWQAVVLHFQPPLRQRRDKTAISATISVGVDIGRT